MSHGTSPGVVTEVNEGNEELARSLFPSLPSVTSQAVGPSPFRSLEISNQAVQRTGASRLAHGQMERQWRLAPVADLCVRP